MQLNLNRTQIVINILFGVALIYLVFQNISHKQKIAYIDSTKIFNGYKNVEVKKEVFQKKVASYKDRMDTITNKIKLDFANIEKFRNDPAKYKSYVDTTEHDKKIYKDYGQAEQKTLNDEEQKLTQEAVEQLNSLLKEYGKNNNYDMILIANTTGTIAYAKDKYDITDEVLKEINNKYDESR